MTTSNELFERLIEIGDRVIPYEIKLMTNYEGWQDSIEMRGNNLRISILDKKLIQHQYIKVSDEKGLSVKIPFEGIEIINEYTNENGKYFEMYFFVYEGFAKLTLVGSEVSITNSESEIFYNQLIKEAKGCLFCENMQDKEAVIGYDNGNLNADILFVAEAPGPRGADVSGIPLQGDVTGNNFEKLLGYTKWTRSDVYITNAVLCCPTDENGSVRKPNRKEVQNCSSYLSKIIELINPKVVVTLGIKALEALKIIEEHQLILKKDVATYTKWNKRYVYPLYHPSPQVINTGTRSFTEQRTDFMQLKQNY